MFEQEVTRWYDLMMYGYSQGWFTPQVVDGHCVNMAIPSPPDRADYPLTRIAAPVSVPEIVDQEHLVPEVLDQGPRGTCVGKTNTVCVGMGYKNKDKLPDGGFSTLFNYSLCKQYDGFPTTEGTFPRVSCKIAHKYGNLEAPKLPYKTENVTPSIVDWMYEKAEQYGVKAYARTNGVPEIEWSMAAEKRNRIAILVTENFVKWDGKGLIGPPQGRIYGFHELPVSKTNRRDGYIRGPNSWGTKWGKDGYYELSYEFLHWKSADLPNFPALRESWAMEFDEAPKTHEIVMEYWIGRPIALVNGKAHLIDPRDIRVAPLLKWSRSMLPTRFLAEQLGADEIHWDGEEQKVTMKFFRL